jgi:hypothetical protein
MAPSRYGRHDDGLALGCRQTGDIAEDLTQHQPRLRAVTGTGRVDLVIELDGLVPSAAQGSHSTVMDDPV